MEISGKDNKEVQPEKRKLILVTFEVFHFEISGKDINVSHPPNILDILMTSEVFHMEISGKDDKEVQYEKEN